MNAIGPREPRTVCRPTARQAIAQRSAERERKKTIDPAAELGVSRQANVLGISRGSVCYRPRPVPDADLKLMRP